MAQYRIDVVVARDGTHAVADAGGPHVSVGLSEPVAGWAVDAPQAKPAGGVAAVIDGKQKFAGVLAGDRSRRRARGGESGLHGRCLQHRNPGKRARTRHARNPTLHS